MKKLLIIVLMMTPVLFLAGCGSNKNTSITREDGETQMMEISEQLMNGEISNEEADKKMNKIKSNMKTQDDTMKDLYSNVSDFDGLPNWAKKLGIYELEGFKFLNSKSSVIKYDKRSGMSDSISLVYAYDNEDKAIQAAEKLVASVGIEESNDSPRILQKNLDKTMSSMMEYMSDEEKAKYEKEKMFGYIANAPKGDYYITITVLNDEISIFANNTTQINDYTNHN